MHFVLHTGIMEASIVEKIHFYKTSYLYATEAQKEIIYDTFESCNQSFIKVSNRCHSINTH